MEKVISTPLLKRFLQRYLIWFGVAVLVCFPSSLFPSSRLIGDPAIDVWNHAWGYWFVFQSLLEGQLPLETPLIGAPAGGSIYYIDTPGAVVALPLTALFGPAVGYNVVLLGRLAIAGFAAQALVEEWLHGENNTPSSKHWGWIAGWATMTLPFLLCELNNGISEVCAIQWGICTLWMTERATKSDSWTNWIGLGIFQGLTISSTFYYGLAFGLLLIFIILGRFLEATRNEATRNKAFSILKHAIAAAMLAVVVASPYAFTFWMSIQSESRLVMRDNSLHEQLLRHNAVDPKIYWMWGQFQSVNLREQYGEPFVHTAYLRWSLLPFAVWAGIQRRNLRLWLGAMLFSLILGLGNFLWWNEEWVYVDGQMLSLPFDWIRQVLPQIAITHPLRLSIGGQVICVVLGIIGWQDILSRFSLSKSLGALLCVAMLIGGEAFLASSATWPIAHSDATISPLYTIETPEDSRGILDLPAEVGTGMETSRYFWFQSHHARPIPYTPDARLGSTRDLQTFKNFMGDGMKEEPHALDTLSILHMKQIYQQIVVHPELDEVKASAYTEIFTEAFGEPAQADGMLYWKLEPLTSEESTPELQTKQVVSSPYSSEGEQTTELSCVRTADLMKALLIPDASSDILELETTCRTELIQYCIQRSKNTHTQGNEIRRCIDLFALAPNDDQQYALMHLFRHPEEDVKLLLCAKMHQYPELRRLLSYERIQQLGRNESPKVQQAIQNIWTEEQ